MSRTICDFHKVMQFEELSKLTAEQLAEEDSVHLRTHSPNPLLWIFGIVSGMLLRFYFEEITIDEIRISEDPFFGRDRGLLRALQKA